jgi:two-component system NtrC family sensor kinase
MREPVITTIREKCRTCYTCVRECPAKAISITSGQAEIIKERCISCGNCVKVCSQKAKIIRSSISQVEALLAGPYKTAAIVAPSFPIQFGLDEVDKAPGVLRAVGFDYVNEVAFGADLVTMEYKKLLEDKSGNSYIATTCPTVVTYVEKYFPELVDKLAPIVSPMIATARALRKIHGDDLKIVFIGPCIAKKNEILRDDLQNEVDEVLTFAETREMLANHGVFRNNTEPSYYDPPYAGEGALFALSGGFLQTADLREDFITENVITANGKINFVEAIKEYSKGYLNTRLLETLACEGCILGPGVSNTESPLYERRHHVCQYVKTKVKNLNREEHQENMKKFADIDLSCKFSPDKQSTEDISDEKLKEILRKMGKSEKSDELNCGACGYETCVRHATAVKNGLAEFEMCLPYTIEKLKKTIVDLKNIKEALDHKEKLANMGQLSAGIAHELNNPLGIILMYANIVLEEAQCADSTKEDLQTILTQANRCKKIVSGLLNFSRQNKIVKTPTDICELIQNCADSIRVPESVQLEVISPGLELMAEIDKDQITQVIINLMNNAMDAMEEKGGKLEVITGQDDESVFFMVKDNGPGIPEKYKKQIFDPFFTTKQMGKGTGLGLSVSYGIIKMHSGSIDVDSNTDANLGRTGTTVKVTLPKNLT